MSNETTRRDYAPFNELPLKTIYSYNGQPSQKRSSRTETLLNYAPRWFYVPTRRLCIVGPYSRLDVEYFN